jgi:glycosyltransferase involved in cell wall biosynthesis
MKIAVIAPLVEPVPPPLYGGTERVISVLVEELVRRGHEVTLFASGDSQTSARLHATASRGLRLDPEVRDYVASTLLHVGEAYRHAREFDIIHNHVDYIGFPFARLCTVPTVTTTHGRLDLSEIKRLFGSFPEQPLVSISYAQRIPVPQLNWTGNVYNAIDIGNYHFRPDAGDYLVFLGRIAPEKRPDRAIEIARDAGIRLVMAAKIDPVDREYWEHAIEPLVRSSTLIDYIGEVNEQEKDALLGGAYAYLFPIDWPEPFGLTMVEAMATGTPVIAYRAGSVPEVVIDGVTGFVCDTVHGMVEAVARVARLDRAACRAHVEQRFTPEVMATGYEAVYARFAGQQQQRRNGDIVVRDDILRELPGIDAAPLIDRLPATGEQPPVLQG